MSDVISRVRALAHSVQISPSVAIHDEAIAAVAVSLGTEEQFGAPAPRKMAFSEFLAEICFAATNYCFWVGTQNSRPGGGSSGLRRAIRRSFGYPEYPCEGGPLIDLPIAGVFDRIRERILAEGFPLAAERIDHLSEAFSAAEKLRPMWERYNSLTYDATDEIGRLIDILPSFGEDPFLKRAIFFPMLLHRVHGIGNNSLSSLPVPADYSLPKVLRGLGAISFSKHLSNMVDARVPIAADSAEECAIRATTIVACERLAHRIGTTEERLDCILWSLRNNFSGEVPRVRTIRY